MATPKHPNVLVICTDQQFAGAMSCAGNEYLDTPAMDRIAATGTRFTESYCAAPVCTPSRGAMLTGRMPHETGITENNDAIPEEYRDDTVGRLFEEAGYECGYAGKWHLPDSEVSPEHGFECLSGHDDDRVVDPCLDFLSRDRDAETPFMLVASFDDPHNICEYARGQNLPWGSLNEPPLEECPPLPSNHAVPPFEPETLRPEMADRHKTLGAMVDASPEEWRRYRNAYYRLVERVDARLGRLLDGLDAEGAAEETLVVFMSDHGDGNGAHQINQKWLLYEEQARVPFVVNPPGESVPSSPPEGDGGRINTDDSRTDDHLVSTGLDLLPTLCDYASITPPADLLGESVRPFVTGEDPAGWRDVLVTETFDPIEGRMVRSDRYKYIVYKRGRQREQLFDMEDDRGELVDLSVAADYDDVLDDHRRHLLEWCRKTNDLFGERHPAGAPLVPGFNLKDLQTYMDTGEEPDAIE
ncbi:sulfatase [Haloferax sp. Atlit-4N]|uniref:sulfatase family protein n=1 Tax=Haloferax sp. Atlit-4N TaxID=2077206 RepID=UPI000E2559A1|nr:sulfatase-like hydrolase/transferase [Haloferax sp. Atlit-4N]RDZ51367.1 sulfatase [Haloferax sp. Atlit-4N]